MKIKPPFVRNPYNYDMNEASDESGISCPEPTLTQQQFAEESDINFIADRYGLTGEVPTVTELPGFGDFSGIFDYQGAHNAVIEAQRKFMTLPAKIRTRFDNDPNRLLHFLENPENRKEAEFLGLLKTPEEPLKSPPSAPGVKAGGENPTPMAKASESAPPPDKKTT